jgi:thioredoxin reductase (NADPH)
VVVVGGANSAGQAALHLAAFAEHVTMLVRGESLARAMSRYLVDRIEAHERITVRTSTQVSRAEGGDWLERVVAAGPEGEVSVDAGGLFVAGDVRHGSIKRVASAVGEGATSIALVHSYLATLEGDRR